MNVERQWKGRAPWPQWHPLVRARFLGWTIAGVVVMSVFTVLIALDRHLIPTFSPWASVGTPAAVLFPVVTATVLYLPWYRSGTTHEHLAGRWLAHRDTALMLCLVAISALILVLGAVSVDSGHLWSAVRTLLSGTGLIMIVLSAVHRLLAAGTAILWGILVAAVGPPRANWLLFWPLNPLDSSGSWLLSAGLFAAGTALFWAGGHLRVIAQRP